MALTFEDSIATLLGQMSPEERAGGVAFAVTSPMAAGARLPFPGAVLDVEEEAYLAFIDRDPSANWGHPARFVLIAREGGASRSVETRLPPTVHSGNLRWRLVYQAPSVPDAAVAFPQ